MNITASRFETHLTINTDSADAVTQLARKTGLSKQRIKQIMQKGAIWLSRGSHTRRLRRAKKILHKGDTLHLYFDEHVLTCEPAPAELIADLGAYSIWYKPGGMLSQGSRWGDHCTITRWVEQHLLPRRPVFLVHRLDRAASGLVLIAHQKHTAAALSALFQERAIEKRYRVIVHGCFPEAKPQTIDSEIDARSAVSHVTRVGYDANRDRSLLDVNIETGRKHQIRRHLSGIGFPVVGDRLYGEGNETEDLQLTACLLSFRCPISQQVRQFVLPDTYLPRL